MASGTERAVLVLGDYGVLCVGGGEAVYGNSEAKYDVDGIARQVHERL